MAMETIKFELVSPERLLMSRDVDMVVVPGEEGDFGVLPGHALFLTLVRPGLIDIYKGDEVFDQIFVAGGFSEVNSDCCTVLAEEAVNLVDVERSDIEERISRNQQAISVANPDEDVTAYKTDLAIGHALLECLDRK